ncbi:MAG: TolC family protein [Deltaproteobacteria bacterium]|nr:TolC family protein [Deltaproteobacteria bacterium]MBN2673088.1 TolC family protein [Deltaproteobacteria bacterium]
MNHYNKFQSILFLLLVPFCALSVAASETGAEGPPAPEKKESSRTVTLTLDECVARAIRNSDKLAAERHRLSALESQKKSLLWEPFSHFYIQGKFALVPDKCADVTGGTYASCSGETESEENWGSDLGPSFHIKLAGAIPIPTSRKMSAGKRALDEGILAKSAMMPSIENEIRFNVHQAFHAITGAREMLYTLSQGRKHLVKAREKIEENLEKQEGTETEIDLVKLKVFEAQLDAMEQEAIKIEKQGLAALNFLVPTENNKRVDIPEEPQTVVDDQLEDLGAYKNLALENRPELEALRHAVSAYEAKVAYQRTEVLPELALVVSLRGGYTPGVQVRENGNDADMPWVYEDPYNYGSWVPAMALVMRYPLDFGKDINKLKQSKAELAAIIMDKKWALDGIMLEVETAYVEVTSAKASIEALNRSKRLARGWMLAAVQNHATGIGSSKEVKDALKEYFGIMAQLHQKIAEYNIGIARLEKVTGGVSAKKKNE